MPSAHIFISHATKDDDFVKALREELEALSDPEIGNDQVP